jgi:hypothetical protein
VSELANLSIAMQSDPRFQAKWCELQWFFQLCLCSGAQHNAALHAVCPLVFIARIQRTRVCLSLRESLYSSKGKQGQSVSFPQGEQWNWVEFIFNDPEMMQQPAFMTTVLRLRFAAFAVKQLIHSSSVPL